MEGSHLQVAGPLLPHQPAYALLHFSGGLVGKGKRQYAPRLQLVFLQQVGYLVGQHTRLARPGASYDQLGTVAPDYRLALAFVQFIEQLFVHCSNVWGFL